MYNVGKTFSANSIVKFLKSEGRSLSVETIYNYLEWLEKAFVIYRCRRYDLQGKAILKTQEKFYLADQSLKYCMMGYSPTSVAANIKSSFSMKSGLISRISTFEEDSGLPLTLENFADYYRLDIYSQHPACKGNTSDAR